MRNRCQCQESLSIFKVAGYWILDTGYWILDTGCWILDTGCFVHRSFSVGVLVAGLNFEF